MYSINILINTIALHENNTREYVYIYIYIYILKRKIQDNSYFIFLKVRYNFQYLINHIKFQLHNNMVIFILL